jgi:hypothetical protein
MTATHAGPPMGGGAGASWLVQQVVISGSCLGTDLSRALVVLACSLPGRPPAQYAPRDPTKTVLYSLVAEQRATFAKVTSDAGGAPSFVNESFERFLRCGVLAHGFARFKCDSCDHEHFVPLSCKTRGLCPSCGGVA